MNITFLQFFLGVLLVTIIYLHLIFIYFTIILF